jgi:citrate lyase subunit alpha/citrate CoA-transferase
MLDFVVLGATEVDLEFNANAATNSDGRLMHNMGGWQDALFSRCTVLTVPTFRNRVPVIKDRVTTLCGVGELIDVVVTERGVAVSPRRADLLETLRGSSLRLCSLAELKAEAEAICGGPPAAAATTDQVIGVVTWADGTILDTVFGVK